MDPNLFHLDWERVSEVLIANVWALRRLVGAPDCRDRRCDSWVA